MSIHRIFAIIIVTFICISYYIAFREAWWTFTSLPRESAIIPFYFILKETIKFFNELITK